MTETANQFAASCLRAKLPPGTVRRAEPTERLIAELCLPTADSLEELKTQLKINPEGPICLWKETPWEAILKTVKESGASNFCRVLVS